MKKITEFTGWLRQHISLKSALTTIAIVVVIVAVVYALCGTLCSRNVAKQLYGEEIGKKGLRYKYQEHIYDPKTGKVLVDSIQWLYCCNDTLAILAKHNKRAYINLNTAALITPLDYDKAWTFSSERGVMVRNDSVYIFRPDGSVVNPKGLPYHRESELVYYHNGLVLHGSEDWVGLLDTAACWSLPPRYDYIQTDYQHRLYSTKAGEQCIVYSFRLDTVLIGNYSSVSVDWSQGLIATEQNGIQHLFDYQGKMLYETIYQRIEELPYNTRQKDAAGKDIWKETDCYVYTAYNGKRGLMDRHYHVLTPPLFYSIEAQTQHIFFASFGGYGEDFGTLIDDHGKPIR